MHDKSASLRLKFERQKTSQKYFGTFFGNNFSVEPNLTGQYLRRYEI